MILLSEHSYERCKERVNIHGSKALIRAEKAYYLGKDIEAFDKVLSKYLANVLEASDGDELKVLGNDIYIFGSKKLITVFPIPQKIIQRNNNSKRRKVYYEEDY